MYGETGKLPGDLSRKELKDYFSHLLKTHSWSTIKCDRNGLRFFYQHVLERNWEWVTIVKPPRPKTLPIVLNIDEVFTVIGAIKKHRYRACIFAIYSMGLRLSEGLKLRVGDIDSQRMMVRVKEGKGLKDRYVPLPQATLRVLREYWKTHRNPTLMFPSIGGIRKDASTAKTPMDCGSMQKAMRSAVQSCNIKKSASIHTLRHSYATHLLEAGLHLRVIAQFLGHSSILTTVKYTHMTEVSQQDATQVLNKLMCRYVPRK